MPASVTIAEDRVAALATLARDTASVDPPLAREYVRLARRVAERNRVTLPDHFKWFVCDACDTYRRPGSTATVRLQEGHVVLKCDCGSIDRHPYDTDH